MKTTLRHAKIAALPLTTAALLLGVTALKVGPRVTQAQVADASDAGEVADDAITVVATIRDFTDTHSDFQFSRPRQQVHTSGMVMPQLDADGRPVLDPAFLDEPFGYVASVESFAQWYRNVPGVNITLQIPITLTRDADTGTYTFQRDIQNGQLFFPIDGLGYDDHALAADGIEHNFWFTTEIALTFNYTNPVGRPDDPATLEFFGDDDVFVFINGQLALSLGGIHGQSSGTVNLDAEAERLGLEAGNSYTMQIFHAERQTTHSNFKLQTNLDLFGDRTFISYD